MDHLRRLRGQSLFDTQAIFVLRILYLFALAFSYDCFLTFSPFLICSFYTVDALLFPSGYRPLPLFLVHTVSICPSLLSSLLLSILSYFL